MASSIPESATGRPARGRRRDFLILRLCGRRRGAAGLVLTGALIVSAVCAPALAPHNPIGRAARYWPNRAVVLQPLDELGIAAGRNRMELFAVKPPHMAVRCLA